MPASSPPRTPLPQLAGQHCPRMQTRLSQSSGTLHKRPSAQGAQLPPQSASVSVPFLTPSAQVGNSQKPELTLQTALVQSPPKLQRLPGSHLSHAGPPQSTSVSAPLCAESSHDVTPAAPATEPPLPAAPDAPLPPVPATAPPVPPCPPLDASVDGPCGGSGTA
jgi:hypothetical protein